MDADWDEVRLSPRCRAFDNEDAERSDAHSNHRSVAYLFHHQARPNFLDLRLPSPLIPARSSSGLATTGYVHTRGVTVVAFKLLTPNRDASSPYTVPNCNDIPLLGYILPAMDLSGSSSSMTRESLPSVLGPSTWPLAGGHQYGIYGMFGWCLC
jgi:hypothetical protein